MVKLGHSVQVHCTLVFQSLPSYQHCYAGCRYLVIEDVAWPFLAGALPGPMGSGEKRGWWPLLPVAPSFRILHSALPQRMGCRGLGGPSPSPGPALEAPPPPPESEPLGRSLGICVKEPLSRWRSRPQPLPPRAVAVAVAVMDPRKPELPGASNLSPSA